MTRKRFGQHFLHDQAVIQRIVQAIAPRAGERVIEIGPGDGAITWPLLAALGRLTVIEFDRDLVPRLRTAAAGRGELDIIQADALRVDFATLGSAGELRLVGNLPYNISTPILFHCIEAIDAIRDMHFMLQKEVVERMAAAPGSKVYGRLSVMLQLACRVESLIHVPPEAFRPPPRVDSALARLTPLPHSQRHTAHGALIARVV
ncbi:MAG: 16S rRNA (adenine(1518)-N(6)/adenine(1519)-N(6))-dimethyltransferase RsmA, partial [Rhodanobacteraceae bacterium]